MNGVHPGSEAIATMFSADCPRAATGNTGAYGRLQIGVMGAALRCTPHSLRCAELAGRRIAQQGAVLGVGATSGIPHAAAKGAAEAGGFVLGISPAINPSEHVNRYGKPLDHCSAIVYTGMGYTGRNFLNIRSCDGVLIIDGEAGTLHELM